MIELLNINGTAISDIDYVEYLGSNFGDAEIADYNLWSKNSIAPTFVPIRKAQFSTAEVRFLVSGAPTQTELEEAITSLVMMLRSTSVPELNYNGFSFVGHCIDFKENRLSGGQAAELTLTVEGFKCVIETITNPSAAETVYFENVVIESPIVIDFIGNGTITIEDEAVVFSGGGVGVYSWNGLTHTLDRTVSGVKRPTTSAGMSVLVFPYARVGGTRIMLSGKFVSSIKCYRRLL